MNFSSHAAPRIKEERKRLGLTQVQAADLAGVTRESWGKYERGEQVPGGEVLFAFAEAGADIQYIIRGERRSTGTEALPPRHAALLDNFEHMAEEDRRCIERLTNSLSQPKTGVNSAG